MFCIQAELFSGQFPLKQVHLATPLAFHFYFAVQKHTFKQKLFTAFASEIKVILMDFRIGHEETSLQLKPPHSSPPYGIVKKIQKSPTLSQTFFLELFTSRSANWDGDYLIYRKNPAFILIFIKFFRERYNFHIGLIG